MKEKVKWTMNDFPYVKGTQLGGIGKALMSCLCSLILLICSSMHLYATDSLKGIHTVLDSHCIKCHGKDGKVKGKVNLKELKSSNALLAKPELLETLIKVLKDRDMPPEDEPPLPENERKNMVVWLKKMLSESLKDEPFLHTPIRRMNRFQYNNAVVDLLESDREIFRLNERLMRRREDYFKP